MQSGRKRKLRFKNKWQKYRKLILTDIVKYFIYVQDKFMVPQKR